MRMNGERNAEIRRLKADGVSLSRIASQLDISLQTVKSLLYKYKSGSARGDNNQKYTQTDIRAQFNHALKFIWQWHPDDAERRCALILGLARQPSWPLLQAEIRERAEDDRLQPL
jgi:hypothetical protein